MHACAEGWVCEQHPDQPWPHDYVLGDPDSRGCEGPGVPCPPRDCVFWNNGQRFPTPEGEIFVTREQVFGWKRRWST